MNMNASIPAPAGLAYVGVASPDAERWSAVGPGVFGLELARDAPAGSVWLRSDDRHHRLAVRRADRNRLEYLGWEMADAATLDALADRLEAHGIAVVRDDAALRDARFVDRVATFADPFGQHHELTVGARGRSPFTPGRPLEGTFVTGDGGFGHAVLITPDLEAATKFYTDVLGFRHSDTCVDFTEARFFHVNPRHHSLALVAMPGISGLHHLMIEVSRMDDVGHAYDKLAEFDVPVTMTLGRHPNDRMFSFYARVPGGFEVEYGYGGLRIDQNAPWETKTYQGFSEWGHKPKDNVGPPGAVEPFAPAGAAGA